jgi:hypothetical protein
VSGADQLEVAPGSRHQNREGWIPELANDEDLRQALEAAFDYRGDITLSLKNGTKVEGYVFDRRSADTLEKSMIRLLPRDSAARLAIPYSHIAALAFTGRDTAAGKSWEAWLRKYWEKKAAGEKGIGINPETLD